MQTPLTTALVRQRTGMQVTQRELAAQMGVTRPAVTRWERGLSGVPLERLCALANVLGIPEDVLRRLWDEDRHLRRVPRSKARLLFMPPYDVKGTLAQMLALHPSMAAIRNRVGLSAELETWLWEQFPRDARLEMAVVYRLLEAGARIQFRSPLQSGCEHFITLSGQDLRYAGHRHRPCLVLVRDGHRWLFFPQVELLALAQSRSYRVDFLARHQHACLDVEADEPRHDAAGDEDDRRRVGLRVPRLGYKLADIVAPRFVEHLLADIARHLTPHPRRPGSTTRTRM